MEEEKKKVVEKPISLHTCMIWNWKCHKKLLGVTLGLVRWALIALSK